MSRNSKSCDVGACDATAGRWVGCRSLEVGAGDDLVSGRPSDAGPKGRASPPDAGPKGRADDSRSLTRAAFDCTPSLWVTSPKTFFEKRCMVTAVRCDFVRPAQYSRDRAKSP